MRVIGGLLAGALVMVALWTFVQAGQHEMRASPAEPPWWSASEPSFPGATVFPDPVAEPGPVLVTPAPRRDRPVRWPTVALPPFETAPAAPVRGDGSIATPAQAPGADDRPELATVTEWPPPRAEKVRRIAVIAGPGVETSLSRSFDAAAQWNLRVLVDPWEHVGAEVGYVGTAGQLRSTSVEALARWYPQSRATLRYFGFAGIGWRRVHAPQPADVATLPLGLGATYARGRWHADTRITLRPASGRGLHTVAATAHLGATF